MYLCGVLIHQIAVQTRAGIVDQRVDDETAFRELIDEFVGRAGYAEIGSLVLDLYAVLGGQPAVIAGAAGGR